MKNFLSEQNLKPIKVTKLIGYLYIRCVGDLCGFITNNSQLVEGDDKMILPTYIINSIIEQDDAFGVLVGGQYFYFAMPIELENLELSYDKNKIILDKVGEIILSEDGISKSIFIN